MESHSAFAVLGHCIDTFRFVLTIPVKRQKKARETGTDLLSMVSAMEPVSVGRVASFVGQIISMSTVI